MAKIEVMGPRKLVLRAAALALALATLGCAAGGAVPESSHGVYVIPSFGEEGGGG
jgi:hypothetical protein